MAVYQILEEIAREKNLSVADIAKICNIPDSTVRGIFRRKQTSIALEVAFKISDGLGVSLEKLNGMPEKSTHVIDIKKTHYQKDEADELAERFRALDEHGRGAVRAILNFEHAAVIAERRQGGTIGKASPKLTKKRSDGFMELTVYDQPAAAGLGNYLDDPASHIEQYPANAIPEGTDFGIKISGRSMEPNIPDGATAFVHAQISIQPGQIGIFRLNGEALCKKLEVDRERSQVRLVSFNSKEFADRIIEECDEFQTMALVLGWYPK